MLRRCVARRQKIPGKGELPRPLDDHQLKLFFSAEQQAKFPKHWTPCPGMAHFLHKDGVPFEHLVDAREEMNAEDNPNRSEIDRDLARDFSSWMKYGWEDFVNTRINISEVTKRLFARVTRRDRMPDAAEFLDVFGSGWSKGPFSFGSYAEGQRIALKPIADVKEPKQKVRIETMPQLRNLLTMTFTSDEPLRYYTYNCQEDLVLTRQFVTELAMYLAGRVADTKTKKPIVCFFSNGRLPYFLNQTGIIPVPVVGVNQPSPFRQKTSKGDRKATPMGIEPHLYHPENLFVPQPMNVIEALKTYEPTLVIAEPHIDRDYTFEMRGYYTVRELLLLGQVDSPAMCSFAYPWLSFGTTPGPDTYFLYNERFMRYKMTSDPGKFSPTDAPFVQQGYQKGYVDAISEHMIVGNDCSALRYQSRALSFRRVVEPRVKGQAPPTTVPELPKENTTEAATPTEAPSAVPAEAAVETAAPQTPSGHEGGASGDARPVKPAATKNKPSAAAAKTPQKPTPKKKAPAAEKKKASPKKKR